MDERSGASETGKAPGPVVYAVDYRGDAPTLERMIVAALARLPEDVRTFAAERCRFVSIGAERQSRCFAPSDRWLVILAEGLDEATAAHEVALQMAHAWLGHETEASEEDERELVAAWEFTGPGGDS